MEDVVLLVLVDVVTMLVVVGTMQPQLPPKLVHLARASPRSTWQVKSPRPQLGGNREEQPVPVVVVEATVIVVVLAAVVGGASVVLVLVVVGGPLIAGVQSIDTLNRDCVRVPN